MIARVHTMAEAIWDPISNANDNKLRIRDLSGDPTLGLDRRLHPIEDEHS